MCELAVRCALYVSLVYGQAVEPAADKPMPTAEAIREAVAQLGHDEFVLRQRATDLLWRVGAPAESALREALRSDDPEVKHRATFLLDKLKFGIRPDTSPEMLALLDQFRFGNSSVKRQALTQLQAKGEWPTILALVRGEEDPARRRQLAQSIGAEAGKLVQSLVEQEKLADAELLLELTAVQDAGVSQLASFLLLTGRLDDHLERLRAKASTDPQEADMRRLALLLRAKGDLPGAIEAADKTTDRYLQANLHSEARDWKRAAALIEQLQKENADQLDHAAFAATFYRLAGDEAGYKRTLDILRSLAETKPTAEEAKPAAADPFGARPAPLQTTAATRNWHYAETLLVNEKPVEAIDVLRKSAPHYAHLLLWKRREHSGALALAGIVLSEPHVDEKSEAKPAADVRLDRAWFDALPVGLTEGAAQTNVRLVLATQVARQLHELGRRELVEQIREVIHTLAAADSESGRRWLILAALDWQLGRPDDAFASAAKAISAEKSQVTPQAAFSALVKTQAPLAMFWYQRLLAREAAADPAKTMATAVWLTAARAPKGKLPADWAKLVEEEAAKISSLDVPQRGPALLAIAETCRIRGNLALARKYFAQAAEISPLAKLKLADLAAAEKDWNAAAEGYLKASEANRADPLSRYLYGYSLVQAGKEKEGRQAQRLAQLMALTPELRTSLAVALQERGLKDDALAQFELVQKTALPDSSAASNASQQVGNLVSGKDQLRAADSWHHILLHVLNTSSNFVDPEGYLVLPHVIHKVRAKALLAEGKTDQALAELDRCKNILPGDIKTAEEMIPRLDKAGEKEGADLLFAETFNLHQQICKEHPASAGNHNNLAWVSARCKRKLDEALEHATAAVKLVPDQPSYLDTLAEVHFQLGDRAAAVKFAKECLALDPENKFHQQRLKHFEEDELRAIESEKNVESEPSEM